MTLETKAPCSGGFLHEKEPSLLRRHDFGQLQKTGNVSTDVQ